MSMSTSTTAPPTTSSAFGSGERPHYVRTRSGEELFAMEYVPTAFYGDRRYCVIAGPLDNEAEFSIRFHVRAARAIAALGFGVVRFDYRGAGNSFGDLADANLANLVDDLADVRAFVERELGARQTYLVGSRFGGALALANCRTHSSELVVLWDPVLDLARYLREAFVARTILSRKLAGDVGASARSLELQLQERGYAELSGLRFGGQLHADLRGFDPIGLAKAQVARGLALLPVAPRPTLEQRTLDALSLRRSFALKHLAEPRGPSGWGAEDFSERSKLREPILQATLTFLRSAGGRHASAS